MTKSVIWSVLNLVVKDGTSVLKEDSPMEISKQLLKLATETAVRMQLAGDGECIAPIDSTGFYLLSVEHCFEGYTPLYAIEVSGKRFVIAWEK